MASTPLSPYEVFLERLGNARHLSYGAVKARISGHVSAMIIKVGRGATLVVGDNVRMACGASIEAWHEVRIGNDVMLAPYVSIIDDSRGDDLRLEGDEAPAAHHLR